MRHTIVLAALLAPLAALSQVQPTTFEGVEALAKKGDYQAQRNLAFGYASLPYKGQEKNPLLACAWYLVVLHSGSPKLGEGDVGNVNVYCGRLTDTSLAASTGQARVIFRQIYKREPKF
jgi:hypothetical protein